MCTTRMSLGLMFIAGVLSASDTRLIFSGPLIVLGLTGKNLSAVTRELINPTRRPSVSLVSETVTFLWMMSPLISGGLLYSARVHHWLRLLVGVVDWCESWLVRLICCQIILKASSPGSPLTASLANCLLVLSPLPSGRTRSGVSSQTWTLMGVLIH